MLVQGEGESSVPLQFDDAAVQVGQGAFLRPVGFWRGDWLGLPAFLDSITTSKLASERLANP